MESFTATAEINQQQHVFVFNSREIPGGKIYSVHVYDNNEWLANFEAKCCKEVCVVIPPAPDWIMENEKLVVRLIRKNNGW